LVLFVHLHSSYHAVGKKKCEQLNKREQKRKEAEKETELACLFFQFSSPSFHPFPFSSCRIPLLWQR
jgi:hypothetical protein